MYISNDRSELVLSLLDSLNNIRVITDLGCMDGATLSGINSATPNNINYYGVDYVMPKSPIASEKITFVQCDLNTHLNELGEIIERTDLILLLDVLEHLFYPEAFLKGLNEMMRANSQLIITVPNASSARKLIAWIKNDFPRNEIGYFDKTHRSWFTIRSIQSCIPNELDIIKKGYIYSKKNTFRFLQYLLPSRLTSQFYILLKKRK